MYNIFVRFRSGGIDRVSSVNTEERAVKEVLRLEKKYKDYPTFAEAFYI